MIKTKDYKFKKNMKQISDWTIFQLFHVFNLQIKKHIFKNIKNRILLINKVENFLLLNTAIFCTFWC